MKRICTFLLVLLLLVQALVMPASAGELSPADRVQPVLDAILSYHMNAAGASSTQDWISGALADQAGTGAEWYVFALSQSGSYDFAPYVAQLRAYLADTAVRSATSRQKYALAFLAAGADDPFIAATMEDAIGQQGVMSWVYGLHLMTNGRTSSAFTPEDAIATLLSLQLEDGGWAITGTVSDVDVTAMVLQALAPYEDTDDVSAAIQRALTLLSSRQSIDGCYSSYGVENPESCAQVLTALSALGIDALQDPRFTPGGNTLLDAMLRFQLEDGSFAHTEGGTFSATATSQVFYSLIAYQRCMKGLSPLYVLDTEASAAQPSVMKTALSSKAIAVCVIAGAALIACVLLFILRKRHRKNFAAVLLVAVLISGFVLVTDFQTADGYYTADAIVKENVIGTVTLCIRCDTVAGRGDHIPADGVILPDTTLPIAQGDTVYTILTEAARAHGIPMENSGAAGMAYIAGIAHLYEYDFGDLSGWMYYVDGDSPSVGCDQYVLHGGETIQWLYTTALGNDLP